MEAELFSTKSYSEIKQGLPASTLKAAGGAYGGGSENYEVWGNGNRSNIDGANGNWRRERADENRKRRVLVPGNRNVKKWSDLQRENGFYTDKCR